MKKRCARCGHSDIYQDIEGLNNEKQPLCKKCYSVVYNANKRSSVRYFGQAKVAESFRSALEGLKLDLNTPDMKETPERMARVFEEYTSALSKDWVLREEFLFSRKFPSSYDEMVTFGKDIRPITANSLCPHHFLPVHMKVYVSYIPNKWVIGLSKMSEFIIGISKQPILQEELTRIIANKIQKELKPLGVGLVIEGTHDCMAIRDVEQAIPVTTTSLLGVYRTNLETRQEFFNSIKGH